MFNRFTVSFPGEGGIELSAWFYLPDRRFVNLPAITMAHGFGLTRFHSLEKIAEAFVEAGFAVLLHDHRGFGESGGYPRHDVNPWQQISDWRRAISYIQARPEVDENRVGIWGASYAGGHAIVLGATDRRLRAVVASVPTTDGFATSLRRLSRDKRAELEELLSADERAQLCGKLPANQHLVSEDPNQAACYRTAAANAFYLQEILTDTWTNHVTLRSTRWAQMYQPQNWIDQVSPTPLLMMIAQNDDVTGTDLALAAYERAQHPKRLIMTHGGHFDQFQTEYQTAATASIDWFRAYV